MKKLLSFLVSVSVMAFTAMGQIIDDPTYDPLTDDPTDLTEDPLINAFPTQEAYGDSGYLDYLQDAAEAGDADAMMELGMMYFNGDSYDVKQDTYEGLNWFFKAAQKGKIDAAAIIISLADKMEVAAFLAGALYEYGEEQDFAEAMRWYQKSGDIADVAKLRLQGKMYYLGQGTARNYNKAFSLFQKASSGSNASGDAMHYLSHCYRFGHGTAQDLRQADYWEKKAQEKGSDEAVQYLEEFKRSGKIR